MFNWINNQLCETDDEGGTFARYPGRGLVGDTDVVEWLSMDHMRRYEVKRVIKDEADFFSFEDHLGRVFYLRPLTLARYRALRDRLLDKKPPRFDSEEELRQHFLVDTIPI
jgi:hypothetical protein